MDFLFFFIIIILKQHYLPKQRRSYGSKQITAGGAPIVLLMHFGATILFEEAGAGQKKSAKWKTEKKEGGTDRGKKR